MKIFTRIKWVASILLVFVIVLITNLVDRDNFNRLSYSVTTMYEDRIVASDLLFELASIIKEKQIAAVTGDSLFYQNQNEQLNSAVDELMEKYALTKFTTQEQIAYNLLQAELQSLQKKEQSYANLSNGELLKSIEKIDEHLYHLSKIQLQQGQQQVLESNRTKDTINLYTQAEIIFLIVMGILVQIMILYNPKEQTAQPE